MTGKVYVSNLRKVADTVLATTKKEKLYNDIIDQAVVMEILLDEIAILTELNNEYRKKDEMWSNYSELVAIEVLSNIQDFELPSKVSKSLDKIINQRKKIDSLYEDYINRVNEPEFNDE